MLDIQLYTTADSLKYDVCYFGHQYSMRMRVGHRLDFRGLFAVR